MFQTGRRQEIRGRDRANYAVQRRNNLASGLRGLVRSAKEAAERVERGRMQRKPVMTPRRGRFPLKRYKPVPVQQRDVFRPCRAGMPLQQMLVIGANFARTIVMANIVEIRPRQRSVNKTQRQPSNAGESEPVHSCRAENHVNRIRLNEDAAGEYSTPTYNRGL